MSLRHVVFLFVTIFIVGSTLDASGGPAEKADGASLAIASTPEDAAVYVDGQFVGRTPLNLPSLGAGDHRVRLQKAGYLENGRIVRVGGGQSRALTVSLTARSLAPAQAQSSGLKIVVIQGEDAVNVIRQQTAVQPVVEVRDRNDQPVAGAIVRFAITRGRASFNGARALSVVTDQAGRAVATGFAPNGTGALQLSATATFQGQTAAVTIAQTNVLAAASGTAGTTAGAGTGTSAGSAAGAAGTTAGATAGTAAVGGAAAGGGGLSATTIGIVAGAAAGGAIAAKKAIGSSSSSGGPTTFAGSYGGPLVNDASINGKPVCTFVINVVGSLTMRLTVASDGSVSGSADTAEPNSTAGPTNCVGATTPGGPTVDDIPVQGTSTAVAFQGQKSFSNGFSVMYTFQGVLNGNELSGTLTETQTFVPGPGALGTGTSSFAVILKQQ